MSPHRSLPTSGPEADVPVVVAGDPGLAAGAFPRRGRPERPRRDRRAARRRRSEKRPCRRRPRRSMSSRSSTRRGASRSATAVPGRPFQGMPAAVRWCSTSRAYGRCVGQSTAIRSNGDTAAGGVEHGAGRVADLVVGVGGRHDRDRRGSLSAGAPGRRRSRCRGEQVAASCRASSTAVDIGRSARRAPRRTRGEAGRGRRAGSTTT